MDGAYATMIQRIHSENNPSFFFLNYNPAIWKVSNFLIVPKYYFTDSIIEKRTALSLTARRAGWIGCNILLQHIPSNGKIFLVRDGTVENRQSVLETWAQTAFLANQNKEKRGWTIEILKVIDKIQATSFTFKEVYHYENVLSKDFQITTLLRIKSDSSFNYCVIED